MFSPLVVLLALLSCLATRVVAQHDESAPFEALFFYYAYLREWDIRNGDTSIGGNACRGFPECSIDRFLISATKPGGQGGFTGGPVSVRGTLTSVYAHSRSLVRGGMTRKLEWDPQKLVIGAPEDKDVYLDHIQYALNTFFMDKLPDDTAEYKRQQMRQLAIQAEESLRLMGEIHAVYVAEIHADWWKDNLDASSSTRFTWVDAKGVYNAWQDSTRMAFDMINLMRTWAYEMPADHLNRLKNMPKKDIYAISTYGYWPHVGLRMTMATNLARACLSK
ncbi:hypothetical protein ACHAQH_008780 [Verticillium albo-atrum]